MSHTRSFFILVFLFSFTITALSQDYPHAVIFHLTSPHSSFPDNKRNNGHVGDHVFYSTADHYMDSSMLVIAPKNLSATEKVDLVFWFHGWHNNIDNAANYYQLTRQFMESHRNAVLVLPEAAKNAADSYGGKLEEAGMFMELVGDILRGLKDKKLIGKDCVAGNILLGGHSGGGELMSFIVEKGGIEIKEAVLFDALYDGTEKFMDWIKKDSSHRFIHLFTDFGYGPKEESKKMVALLKEGHLSYFETEETTLTVEEIQQYRLLYIHSIHPHNDIIFHPDNFKLLFENSPFLKKLE